MTRSRGVAVVLALLVVASASVVAIGSVGAATTVQRPANLYCDAVTAQIGLLGWSPNADTIEYGQDGNPAWVVEVENGSIDALEAWANASSDRTLKRSDNESNVGLVVASPSAVGISWSLNLGRTPLKKEAYVESICVNRKTAIDPIQPGEHVAKSDWSKPAGYNWATFVGQKGSLDADGAAWSREVNTSSLQDVRTAVDADAVSATGAGVRVAVLDTGLNYQSDLYGNRVVAGYNAITNQTIDVAAGNYSAVADGSDSKHGSWVATAIAGNGPTPNGTGIAPGASLIPVKVLGDDGSGSTANIARGLEWACEDANADVISMSLGSPWPSQQIQGEIEECLEDNDVSAVVVAAGNNRLTTRWTQAPGQNPRVITVAATDSRQLNKSESAYFSAVGPDPETGVTPDVGAPGLKVTAEVALSSNATGSVNRTLSGTSMSTPVVSGVIALTLDAQPQLEGEPAKLERYLKAHTSPMKHAGETEVGAGRVNASASVQDVEPASIQEADAASARDEANQALSGSWMHGALSPSAKAETVT